MPTNDLSLFNTLQPSLEPSLEPSSPSFLRLFEKKKKRKEKY